MSKIFFIAAILLASAVAQLQGQAVSAPADPFGRIFSTSVRPEVQNFDRKLLGAKDFTLIGLSLRDSDSSTSGGFSVGYGGSVVGRDFFLNGSYSSVDLDDGDSSNRASAYGQIVLVPEGFASLAAVATAAYDPDAFKVYGLVLAAEKSIIADKLAAVANLGWTEIDPDGGKAVSGVQPAVGLSFSPSELWTFSVDYTFDNDVDGEDTGSFAASLRIPRFASKAKLAGEKHNVYSLSVTKTL
jgi:hypothetical protein